MINLIGISGRIGSGKDTVAKIIQYLTLPPNYEGPFAGFVELYEHFEQGKDSGWQVKKFAGKLKQIASLLTGIPAEKFEDQEFKKTTLGPEWCEAIGTCNLGYSSAIKYLTVREFLQRLGTEAIRNNIHTNAWVNALFADYKPIRITEKTTQVGAGLYYYNGMQVDTPTVSFDEDPKWLVTDTRFPNEAQAIKDRGGIVIRVERPNQYSEVKDDTIREILKTTKNFGEQLHPSETALDDWEFDWKIMNKSTIENLVREVQLMLLQLNIIQTKAA